MFGHVSQNKPLYLRTKSQKNVKIKGLRSAQLKSSAPLCRICNSERTQPHDRAWEHLSRHLRERRPKIRVGDIVRLERVFPGSVTASMLHVHLYFVKLFGCMIVANDLPLDIAPFRMSIMDGRPHPNIHIGIGPSIPSVMRRMAGYSDVELLSTNGACVYALWFYYLDEVAASITYAAPSERRRSMVHAWHPQSTTKRLRMVGFEP